MFHFTFSRLASDERKRKGGRSTQPKRDYVAVCVFCLLCVICASIVVELYCWCLFVVPCDVANFRVRNDDNSHRQCLCVCALLPPLVVYVFGTVV